ncbi:uncharacterized protein MYCFIDRAFT_79561 [Pseudocercospora fijiensis CIRAD86]|uniref:Uncharacterized protein n=1 Tax=Pseudocercospora fijiensis (strain CIRAD86) TaxID=383855 RepID=M3API5_PSEFD|nr:uncharacterized protein MYCFIDRAFT_79561 [Pseudocercospora fijiensis CIRAD86]EME79342.1 hypothetical protein MYCFIDRAFT_79561 [Pseudocercospora fijiensis CIRAD86]
MRTGASNSHRNTAVTSFPNLLGTSQGCIDNLSNYDDRFSCYGEITSHREYATYFSYYFKTFITVFAFLTTILSAMQVILVLLFLKFTIFRALCELRLPQKKLSNLSNMRLAKLDRGFLFVAKLWFCES